MCGGARAAQALQHVNLLLVLFAGASLATGARLHWDPSAYIPLRELMPFEYRVLAGAVPAAGAAMLALAHLALAATRRDTPSRAMLYTYACLMATAIILEVSLVGWMAARIHEFMNSPEAEEMQQILATREHLQPLLEHLARWHPISEHLKALIKEAEEDVPWNGYVAAAAMAALLFLQMLGVVFALLATRTTKRKTKAIALSASRESLVESLVESLRSSLSSRSRSPVVPQTPASVRSFRSVGGKSDEWAPLKAKYKNGRIVPV